jgi:hypothetical protein
MNWQPLNLASPGYAVLPEPPSIAGLLYAGKRHLLSGPPESLKTMLAYILALEHIRAGGKAAIIDLEIGPETARLLLGELGATEEEIRSVYYVEPESPPSPGDLEAMLAAGVTFAVVDAAAGAYGLSDLDDNKRQDAERFARVWLELLWKHGVTTLVVDHVVKDTGVRGRYAIGSERKLGQADVHLGLHVVRPLSRGGSGLVRIDAHKDRPGFLTRPAAAELELESEAFTHAISWEFKPASADGAHSSGWRPTWYMEAVLEFLERQDEPVSQRTIEAGVGRKREYVRLAVDMLADEGAVNVTRGARNAKLISLRPECAPSAEARSYSGFREGA